MTGSSDRGGCGNAGAVETTDRFPPRLGNLAQTRDFHIPTADYLLMVYEKEEQAPTSPWVTAARQMAVS